LGKGKERKKYVLIFLKPAPSLTATTVNRGLSLILSDRCNSFEFWILDFGFWILDFGFWILDFGFVRII
jgi:hypothetical protein